MVKLALFARLEAKPGKEQGVATFLESSLDLALRLSPTMYGVFDAFEDEGGRRAHLDGPLAAAVMARAPELLAEPPRIEAMDVLGLKNASPVPVGKAGAR